MDAPAKAGVVAVVMHAEEKGICRPITSRKNSTCVKTPSNICLSAHMKWVVTPVDKDVAIWS